MCPTCGGLLYKDEEVHTCRSCGRHVYLLHVTGITYGPKNMRRSEGGRNPLKHLQREID